MYIEKPTFCAKNKNERIYMYLDIQFSGNQVHSFYCINYNFKCFNTVYLKIQGFLFTLEILS